MVLSRTWPRGRAVALTGVCAVLLAACASDEAGSDATGSRPLVVATTSIWGDVARNVACDGMADIVTIIPAGSDPHTFEPSLRDREDVDDAALVVANGLDLEGPLLDVLDTVAAGGTRVFEMAGAIDTIPAGGGDHDDSDEDAYGDGDSAGAEHVEHEGDDPHVWQDPSRVAAALPALGAAMVDAGFDAAAVDACIATYTAELTDLDREIAALVATLPADRRVLVTNHDSLAYFADRYGFDVLGTVIPAATTLAETNPADLEQLARTIEATGVPAIFAEEQHSTADVDALADRVGDVEVVTLHTDALGPDGSGADTYAGLMRANAEAIVDALSG